MSERARPPEAQMKVMRHALIAGSVRGLDLRKRVPQLLRERGWPQDEDLIAALCVAVGLTKVGAGATVIRRPPAADGCAGWWPREWERRRASRLVMDLELDVLYQNR